MPYAMANGGNNPETQEKEKQKGKANREIAKSQIHIFRRPLMQTRRGAYARSDWDLKTNERSVAKKMPLLGEFSSYSELGGKRPKGGPKHYIITQ